MSLEVAKTVALMKEAEGHVDKITGILTDAAIEGLEIEQEDLDVVYELLDKLYVINSDTDICETLQPVMKRIQSAELMITLRDELESLDIPRTEQAVLIPMGL